MAYTKDNGTFITEKLHVPGSDLHVYCTLTSILFLFGQWIKMYFPPLFLCFQVPLKCP